MSGNSFRDLVLRSAELEVGVSPRFGGGITSVRHRSTGMQVLWSTPWSASASPSKTVYPSVDEWVSHSRGGWQVLLPNAGDDCEWHGVRHGFHGESSIVGWRVADAATPPGSASTKVVLHAHLDSVPLDVERIIQVEGARVGIAETVTNRSGEPVSFMWTHHPGFGGALLEGPTRIDTNARTVTLDDVAPVIGLEAQPGDSGPWPSIGRQGAVDLRVPQPGTALLGYLTDFDGEPWVCARREDGTIGVRVSWTGATFPFCWFWQELGGTAGAPWHGAVRVVGIEPATSWPGQGIATVASTTRTEATVGGGESLCGAVSLEVRVPAEPEHVHAPASRLNKSQFEEERP